ncbi:MAG: ExbD/TolR family protein [Francisellaceae bacterium]
MEFEKRTRSTAISLVPMIDVLMCLLIFFMLSTQFIDFNKLTVKAVSSQQNTTTKLDDTINIAVVVSASGLIFNGKSITLDQLSTLVAHKYPDVNRLEVTLLITDNASLQDSISVYEGLKRLKIVNIKWQNSERAEHV